MMPTSNRHCPIGVFDSGIGGLTVLRALQQAMPFENFLYLGDTARLPYGTKSAQTVKNYALNANDILVDEGIKALVVACNTATSVAIDALTQKYAPLPVFGVIKPGASATLDLKNPGSIIVLATEGTTKWHAYRDILAQLSPEREVIEWPCSLLVALAEEGWCDGELVEKIIAKLLEPLLQTLKIPPAGVVLGCTHFPVLKNAIQNVLGTEIPVIDPANAVSQEVHALLKANDLLQEGQKPGITKFMATDGVDRFARVAQTFLGVSVPCEDVELVTVQFNQSEKAGPTQGFGFFRS